MQHCPESFGIRIGRVSLERRPGDSLGPLQVAASMIGISNAIPHVAADNRILANGRFQALSRVDPALMGTIGNTQHPSSISCLRGRQIVAMRECSQHWCCSIRLAVTQVSPCDSKLREDVIRFNFQSPVIEVQRAASTLKFGRQRLVGILCHDAGPASQRLFLSLILQFRQHQQCLDMSWVDIDGTLQQRTSLIGRTLLQPNSSELYQRGWIIGVRCGDSGKMLGRFLASSRLHQEFAEPTLCLGIFRISLDAVLKQADGLILVAFLFRHTSLCHEPARLVHRSRFTAVQPRAADSGDQDPASSETPELPRT